MMIVRRIITTLVIFCALFSVLILAGSPLVSHPVHAISSDYFVSPTGSGPPCTQAARAASSAGLRCGARSDALSPTRA